MVVALYVSIFIIATCGLVYELIAGALASYLLGDTILQFSTIIGAYLFAMGIGSYLSRFIARGLIARFVQVEALVGLVGGFAAPILFAAFTYVSGFRLLLYALVTVIGTLVGLEIPLLIRILKDRVEFKDLVAQVLSLDYLGALGASLLFPLVLVPRLGLLNTSFLFGIANTLVALWTLHLFRAEIPARAGLRALCLVVLGSLLTGAAFSAQIGALAEGNLYADEIIMARSTPYQRLVVTRWKDDLRLFINAHLQFSSVDEYRYHEALVHPGLSSLREPREVLILGGGDGLAAREVLKDPRVERVTLVDLDPEMTRLFSRNELLARLNGGSLRSPKLSVVPADAFTWLESGDALFDFVVVDFPDPSNFSLGKLYTTTFYARLRRHLKPGGLVVVQATSPLFARKSFWCVENTMKTAGFGTAPYHAYVPSFGEWGFVLGTTAPYRVPRTFPPGLKYLTPEIARGMFDFPRDMSRIPTSPNRLNTQVLVGYYESEWESINH